MEAKDKAKELVDKYDDYPLTYEWKKQCALITIDEILNEFPKGFNGNFEMKRKLYWQEVKQEIINKQD